MLNKIKNSLIGIIAVAIAGAAVIYLYNPTRGGRDREDVVVTLKITFSPPQTTIPVLVTVRADGGDVIEPESITESPWTETGLAHPGEVITLTATRAVVGPRIECTIMMHGRVYGPVVAMPTTKGASSCVVTATA